MVAGVLASAIESVGDYYACARLAGTSHMQYIICIYSYKQFVYCCWKNPINCWYFSYVPKNNSSTVKITNIVILTTSTQVQGKMMIECLDHILDIGTHILDHNDCTGKEHSPNHWLLRRLSFSYLAIGTHILDHNHCFDGKEHNPDDCLLRRPSPTTSRNQQRNWYWRLWLRPCR